MAAEYFVTAYTKGDGWTAQAPVWHGRVSRPRYALRRARLALRKHVAGGGGAFPRERPCTLVRVGVYSCDSTSGRPTLRRMVTFGEASS